MGRMSNRAAMARSSEGLQKLLLTRGKGERQKGKPENTPGEFPGAPGIISRVDRMGQSGLPQHDERIDAHGAARRHGTGRQRDHRHRSRDCGVGDWISGIDAV